LKKVVINYSYMVGRDRGAAAMLAQSIILPFLNPLHGR